MDPNETLRRLRRLTGRVLAREDVPDDVTELAELVESLDVWLTSGGFVPDGWPGSVQAVKVRK